MNKVLYVCGAGNFCGATKSLQILISPLRNEGKIYPVILSSAGTAIDFYRGLTDDVVESFGLSKFDNTDYSYYRGIRWLILLREIAFIPFTFYSIYKVKRKFPIIDIIHINEVTNIPSLILLKFFYKVPIIMHVRSVFRKGDSIRSRIIRNLINKYCNEVICIDENVKDSLGIDTAVVIHNSFVEDSIQDRRLNEILKDIPDKKLKVGFIGNLLRSKGIFDLLEAAVKLRDNQEVVFLILGDELRNTDTLISNILIKLNFIENTKLKIKNIIQRYNLESKFILLGKSKDLNSYFKHIDILCFPSHLDAPGRPIIEAAYYSIPSLACITNPKSDTFIIEETGVLVTEKSPDEIVKKLLEFQENNEMLKLLGRNAKQLADSNFNQIKNSNKVHELYTKLIPIK